MINMKINDNFEKWFLKIYYYGIVIPFILRKYLLKS